jgi:AraC family transcriptional activator of pyochelin receptor
VSAFTRNHSSFFTTESRSLVNYREWLVVSYYLIALTMDLTIQTSANEILPLRRVLPSAWPSNVRRIPGSEAWTADGDFGTIFMEEFRSGPFTIRFTFFRLLKKMTLYCTSQVPAVCTRIATKNNWRFSVGSTGDVNLREGQFALFRVGTGKEKIVFEKGKEYQSFDAFCPPGKLEGLIALFPTLHEFLDKPINGKHSFLVQKPNWIAPEAMDIVKDIPECPFDNSLRDYYVENRLEQLFFILLALALKAEPEETEPLEDEIIAAKAAEKIILSDIRHHYPIPVIAKRVHLNEFRLKYVFKRIFKTGIFEYLLQARMQEAKKLLSQTDKPIKEIASLTGYQRLTSFITAFRKHFGYTPGSVRRTSKDNGSITRMNPDDAD